MFLGGGGGGAVKVTEKKDSKKIKTMSDSNSQTDDEFILESAITARFFDSQKDNFRHIEMYETAYDQEEHYVDNLDYDQAQNEFGRICAIDQLDGVSGGILCKSCVLRERERERESCSRLSSR